MSNAASPDFLALQEVLVGKYSLQREIGRGGMGIVYLAQDVSLDRPVAIKLLPPAFAAQPALRERFLREARTAAKLSQPNIVPIHSVEEAGEFVLFVMAYVEGETLGEHVRKRGPLASTEGARILREVAWALAYAHNRGVVHRDVKPDNVMIESETGRALIMDFGIAQVSEGPAMTGAGEILGTAEFMSPEQAAGEDIDERTDVYAMGILAHFVLSGTIPFQGSTVAATLAQHLTQPAPPLVTVVPEVPASLASAVDKCLEKSPDNRFPNGEQLAEALSKTLEERRVVAVPLRSFIEESQERLSGLSMWIFMTIYLMVISIVVGVAAEGPEIGVVLALMTIAFGAAPLGLLGRMTRQLIRSGHDREDLIRALRDDLRRRREERPLGITTEASWLDKLGRWLVIGGVASMALATLGLSFLPDLFPALVESFLATMSIVILSAGGLIATLVGIPIAAMQLERGKRLPGDWFLQFWESAPGGLLFGASGLGVTPQLTAASYRPTEVLIGSAADRLFKELPKEVRQDLAGLPGVIDTLEADAHRLREHVDELDRLLGEIEDGPERVAGDERAELAADLRSTRAAAQKKLNEAVASLETIRLGLMRLSVGEGSVEGLTMDLGSAREVSDAIDRLITGRDEVDKLLGGDA